jgi:hypothetical protein
MPMQPAGQQQASLKDLCKKYHLHLVRLEGTDGNIYEGIIEDVNEDSVDMLIPVGDVEDDPDYGMRQYFGQMGYGGYPRRFRRFRRRRFPFFIFRRLLFPHFY